MEAIYNIFFRRVFPWSVIYRWLSYGDADNFAKREFVYTLGDNTHIRYQSYNSLEEFTNEAVTDISKHIGRSIDKNPNACPIKIDIGAMCYPNPNEVIFGCEAVKKEVTFDIDISDYDDIRTCCSEGNLCRKCWKFLAIAGKVIDITLKEDFGLNHILWVFSGRRGIHAWVCDENVQSGEKIRTTLGRYIQLVQSGRNTSLVQEKIKLSKTIPAGIRRALSIIDSYFIDILSDQDILGTDERLQKFLELLDDSVKPAFQESMSQVTGSVERWTAFENTLLKLKETGNLPETCEFLLEQVKLYFAYPRIDVPVTVGLNHLLKAPLCIHPKTGKVCVPFSINSVDYFDPDAVPTIDTVVEEIRAHDKKEIELEQATKRIHLDAPIFPEFNDISHTSLLGYVNILVNFVSNLEEARRTGV